MNFENGTSEAFDKKFQNKQSLVQTMQNYCNNWWLQKWEDQKVFKLNFRKAP